MKSTLVAVFFLMISQSTHAQLAPVLHDADGLPIGNFAGFGAAMDVEYVNIISLKGYRAKMSYRSYEPRLEGDDLPGYSVREFFESTDCTGDPVLLPVFITLSDVSLNSDFSNLNAFLSNSKLYSSGLDELQSGDMFTFGGNSYYVPLDAVPTTIETKSMIWHASIGCQLIERCSVNSWYEFGKLAVQDINQEQCPNFPVLGNPKFEAVGFSLSTVRPNDPAVTGFQSIKYKGPLRVKYLDINLISKNGFEASAE